MLLVSQKKNFHIMGFFISPVEYFLSSLENVFLDASFHENILDQRKSGSQRQINFQFITFLFWAAVVKMHQIYILDSFIGIAVL